MKKLPEGEALIKRCQELGINIDGNSWYNSSVGPTVLPAVTAELQQRLIDRERSIREGRLWVIALISAIASVVSAVTAIIVVVRH